ncbi:MgtC/SapB transporter [sediment metagenome]|uniref:MgtC/SapB transporter n=1 Tax=sediment metagenome TaxID=749907 RepID=D9PMB6_9ZZZZ
MLNTLLQGKIINFVISLVMAILLGGVIGIERKLSNKAAGFRTMILICMGSALFTEIGVFISQLSGDHNTETIARVIGNIIAGIGFLGAGSIMKTHTSEKAGVEGLTTAAAIWMVAGIGLLIGLGYYLEASIATLFAFLVLITFSHLEKLIINIINYSKRK